MVINIFKISAIIGLTILIIGTILVSSKSKKRRKYVYPLFLVGGICLVIYSINLKDTIFIILQAIFIISAIFGLIRMKKTK